MVEHLLCALPGRPRFDDAHRAVRFHGRDLRPFEDLRQDAVGSVLDHQRDDAAGEAPNGENGGGALALPTGTDDREAKAAYTFAHSDGVKGNLAQEGIPPLKSTLGDPRPRPMISSEGRSPTPSSPRRPRTCAPTSRICRTRRTRTRSPWIPSASHTTANSPCTRPCSSGANRSRNMEKSKASPYGRPGADPNNERNIMQLLWSCRPHDRNPFIIRRARQSDIQPLMRHARIASHN